MREGLFSAIVASEGPLTGRRFLDLYAGTGAIGLEAWSRGADHVLAVERDQRAARVLRANVEALGADGAVVVLTSSVDRVAVTSPAGGPYDVVFADPPYELADQRLTDALRALELRGWLAPGTLVVVERRSRRDPFGWPGWVEPEKSRGYGEATLWYARVREAPERPAGPPTDAQTEPTTER